MSKQPSHQRAHLVESVSFRGKRVECTCGKVLTIDPAIGPPRPFWNDAERNEAVAELFRLHRKESGLVSLPDHVYADPTLPVVRWTSRP
jgi:hypothetical protein